ncbi:hypothetical protein FZC83_01825 [Rossellomorea marisflavi]|uniref:Uncharacterized protein n=2 Tax=Rossellomorea marisflavi TaxID=189381 RepID=A0A5D4S2K4_9BACI|nr:hypothetical protein [Rossellomorea marisflavi]TYS56334.1 hypothetical protein FZC83_01825 [Rossellomorea marisflavi]
MEMFKPSMSEDKQERLRDYLDKLERAYEKLINTLEEGDFDASQLEVFEKLDKDYQLRLSDLRDEINFSNIG